METTIIAPANPTTYDQVDFKAAYEKLFENNQRLQRRLQNALDRIDYLEKENARLKADNAYLKKMLFSQKSEQRKKKLQHSLRQYNR